MKKRIQLDVFMELEDFSLVTEEALNLIKDKAVHISEEEKSSIKVHDCGHDEGKPCKNVVEVL